MECSAAGNQTKRAQMAKRGGNRSGGPPSYTNVARSDHPGTRVVAPEEWPRIRAALGLTPRETQVVSLLFQGVTRQGVANQLRIQERTVRQYLEQIHHKLGVQDRVELVLHVVETRDQLRDYTT